MSENTNELNLSDIESLVQDFLEKYQKGISTLHRISGSNSDRLSFLAFVQELTEELLTGCVTFVNNHDTLDDLDTYLFYIANAFAKRKTSQYVKKSTEYLCPGCLYFSKSTLITLTGSVFKCDECNHSFKSTQDPKQKAFFGTFKHHNKRGYKCPECNRFIPHPIYGGTNSITCPYLDCCFVGDIDILKKMHHPSSQTIPEKLYSDIDLIDQSTMIGAYNGDSASKLQEKEQLLEKIKVLQDVIDSQSANAPYSGADFTLIHKLSTYQAFKNLLDKYPEDMVDYLLHQSRSGGFQTKVFQEYVRILEESFPICYKKGNKVYRIDSLLDPNLSIFDGISVFDAVINNKLEIKNNTQEFYIGGRKAAYSQPYYIGKLLNIIDKNTKTPLTDNVMEYSFSKIKMRDVSPDTEVIVTHLRVPPHYQMGGMVYINRLRKKIVDRAISILGKSNE